jgi:uncharacterized protein (TIGR02271 family)
MIEAGRIKEGMAVRSADGEKLGKVLQVTEEGFLAEKGLFFPKDYFCRFSDITDLRDDEIHIRYRKDELDELMRAADERGQAPEGRTNAPAPEVRSESAIPTGSRSGMTEEQRIPLAEEEIIPEKRSHQAGEVHVRKDVVTEQKTVVVPVTREEVKVEVVPTQGAAPSGERAFEQSEVTVPVMEEEVELRKRAVSRGEARISKEEREQQVSASAEVRREEIDVEESGESRRTPAAEGDEAYSAGLEADPRRR